MDLSQLGILVKDTEGNLQEKKLEEAFGLTKKVPPLKLRGGEEELRVGSNSPQPSLNLREGVPAVSDNKLHDFRQQLAKVSGGDSYQVPIKRPIPPLQPLPTQPVTPAQAAVAPVTGYKLQDSGGKVVLHHLSGPAQELGSLTIADLRRWGGREQIVQKLLREVALLQKDSVIARAAGVRAWQKSPLHQLYLDMGRQSMMEDKPLGQVVEERTKLGQPTLSLEEFEALMEANEQMRY